MTHAPNSLRSHFPLVPDPLQQNHPKQVTFYHLLCFHSNPGFYKPWWHKKKKKKSPWFPHSTLATTFSLPHNSWDDLLKPQINSWGSFTKNLLMIPRVPDPNPKPLIMASTGLYIQPLVLFQTHLLQFGAWNISPTFCVASSLTSFKSLFKYSLFREILLALLQIALPISLKVFNFFL